MSAVTVTPTASNKNFQVRTFVGSTEYQRTAAIPVEDGTVITVKCGDPSWPSMNSSSDPAQVYTFTVSKESATSPQAEPVAVTVNVAPSTVNVAFYSGSAAGTALAATAVEDKGTVKVGSYNFHQYVLTVPAGEYSYRGTDGATVLGGEQFTVTEDETQTINLLRANIRYNGASLNQEGDYTFTLKNGENDVVCGTPYVTSNIRYTPTLLIAGVAHTGSVALAEKNLDEFYLSGSGAGKDGFTSTPSKTTGSAATINLPIT